MSLHAHQGPGDEPSQPDRLSPEERAIIERLSRGDRDALGELAELYRKRLEAVARDEIAGQPSLRAVINPSDIVQSVFKQVSQNWDRYLEKGMASSPFGWLYTMVVRKASDKLDRYRGAAKRDVTRQQSLGDHDGELVDDSAETPSRIVVSREDLEQLGALLKTLSEVDQEIFRLWLTERLNHRQIGERLGMKENTVSAHVSRALKTLRKRMEETGPTRTG